ncbi:MAG: PQQ-like beta-propeller repeat protein [Phycisphaerales bacterium]|jgi:outer membrane protein assembly factor BamB|nr:PQQ-like beta-propeller repeat protein [Phycisphaerales bacterium]
MMATRKMRCTVIGFVLAGAIATLAIPAAGQVKSKLIAAAEPGWPQWRGTRRDGLCDETGLLTSWPQSGPKVLWTVSGLGKGWSSPVFSKDAIYITGDVGNELTVFALTRDGKPKWKSVNGKAWAKPFGGARGSCAYDDGRVFSYNAYGRLACFNAENGEEIWAVDTAAKYGAAKIYFGMSESPLIDGDGVIVTVGGSKALMVRLDKKTGKELWKTKPKAQETATYCSSILADLGGKRQIITCGSRHAFGINAKNGKVIWAFRHEIEKGASAAIPVLRGDLLFISNSSREKGLSYCLKIDTAAGKATKVWGSQFANFHGSVVDVDGKIYGASRRTIAGWARVDFASGKIDYVKKDIPLGSLICAEGHLYWLAQSGKMTLQKPADKGLQTVGSFDLAKGKKDAWAHPVILGGRMYLRYGENLYCYDISKK